MATDGTSTILGLLEMATGNHNNDWGDSFVASVQRPLEKAIAGIGLHTATGGTLDLSASPLVEHMQYFNGTLASDATVIVPDKTKTWLFINATGGPFQFLVKTPTSGTVNIPQGTEKHVFVIAQGSIQRLDRHEVGMIQDFAGGSVPPGWIECAGGVASRTRFPDLFAKIGTTWGPGDGSTTFGLPNLGDTGRFRRSRTGALAAGSYQSNQLLSHTHTASSSGSGTTDTQGSHNHGTATGLAGAHTPSGTTDAQGSHSHNGTVGSTSIAHTHSNAVSAFSTAQFGPSAGTTTLVTGITLGSSGGMSANDPHSHSVSIDTQGAHAHNLTMNPVGDHQHAIGADGAHAHNVALSLSTTIGAFGGSETRPESAVFITCIKY